MNKIRHTSTTHVYLHIHIYRLCRYLYMHEPCLFFKCLSDPTRLKSLLLIYKHQELCVCDLITATGENQSKISRHLSQLRTNGLLKDRRHNQWVYYSLHPTLPQWALDIINTTANQEANTISLLSNTLMQSQNCCN